MIFQDPFASLNPRQTVGRIISDGPVASGTPRHEAEQRARELLGWSGWTRPRSRAIRTSSRAASASASASPGRWR
jgi:ABC-type dipeptide/oligopeptide/nickel transport system ATPase subunit